MKKNIIIALVSLISSTIIFAQSKAGKQDVTKHTVLYSCPAHHQAVVFNPAKCPNCGMDLNLSQKEQMKMQITKAYSCPPNANNIRVRKGNRVNLSPKEEMKMQAVKFYNDLKPGNGMDMAMSY
ncbi:MAG: hypothetical protein ACHQF0_13655 [Chitinophagales bacterium]